MRQVKTKLFATLFFHLSFFALAQDLIYQFKDDFNNNKNYWRLVNTPNWESKIENGYLSITNKTQNQISYFRPNQNVIPKSAIYKITAKISLDFGELGDNYMSGGFNFIRSENINSDGSYSTKNDDIKIGFTKFQNKSFVIFEGFGAVFSWKPIEFDLTENEEYTIQIIIDNTLQSEQVKIKINEQLIYSYSWQLFNFTNIGVYNYPNGALKVNSLEILSFGGTVNFPIDIFCYDFNIDENGNIINSKPKDIEYYESQLLNYIPKELIDFIKTPVNKRNTEMFIEKLVLNPEVKTYKILPENENEFNIVEQHCFYYRNGDNAICLPISLGKNDMKIIMNSTYRSDNRKKLISYSNIISSIFSLTNIKSNGDSITIEINDKSWERLFIGDSKVTFWF